MKLSMLTLGVAAVAVVLLVMAGPSYRMGAALPTAFALLRWGAYIGLAAAALGLLAATLAFRQKRMGAVVAAWVRHEDRRTARLDARLDAEARSR